MSRWVARLTMALMALACLVGLAFGQTRVPTVDDALSLEAFGRASISPDGRWAVYERRGPYESATRFDLGQRSVWTIMDLRFVDLRRPGSTPERLLPDEPLGLVRAGWSPSGARLLVYRLRGDQLEAGIVTLADRSVRWTGLTPEMPEMGAAFAWTSDDQLVLLTRRDGELPWLLRYYHAPQALTAAGWRDTARGRQASRTVMDAVRGVVSAGPSAPHDLVLIDCRSGRSRTLYRGRVVDFEPSPDGTRIAVIKAVSPRPLTDTPFSQSEVPWVQALVVLNTVSGRIVEPSAPFEPAPHLLRWSPDGRGVLVWGRSAGQAWRDGDLRIVARDGEVTGVDRHGIDPAPSEGRIDMFSGVRADWLGSVPVLFGQAPGARRADWHTLSRGAGVRAITASMTVPPDRITARSSGSLIFIADGAVWVADSRSTRRQGVAPDGLVPVSIADIELPFRLRLNAAPVQDWIAGLRTGGGIDVVSEQGSMRLGPAVAPSQILAASRRAALVVERSGLSEALVLQTEGQDRVLDRLNQAEANVELPAPLPINHLNVAGKPTRSWLFLPSGRTAREVRGIVIAIYPGSADRGAWAGPSSLARGIRPALLAGSGYAVLSASIPGADYGPDPADYFTRSVDLALEAAAKAQPGLPVDRTAVLGHSFGGYAALAIATRSTRHQTYIALSASTDLFGAWGELTPANRAIPDEGFPGLRNQQGWVEVGQAHVGAPPFGQVAAYAAGSPYLAADRVSAPVLLITADMDFVPASQSERMFSALSRLGRRVRLVTYRGEEHFLWSPANIRDLYQQIFGWLDETIASPDVSGQASGAVGSRPAPSPRRPPRE